jgi:uncharacterized protein YodC (DUF2158 family)
MSDFKVGDVVELKSGGPNMTISELQSGGGFMCQWFNNAGSEYKLETVRIKGEISKQDPKQGGIRFAHSNV